MLRVSTSRPGARYIRTFSTPYHVRNIGHRPPEEKEEKEEQVSIKLPPPPNTGPSTESFDLIKLRQRLLSLTDQAIISFRKKADVWTAETKTTVRHLGSHLNTVTGYDAIDALKKDVVARETRINEIRRDARKAKEAHEIAVAQRSQSQREVNDLLQRKSTWNDGDVSRFTKLVREDHIYEQGEIQAKTNVDAMDEAVEREFSELMRAILARYHEEQVWSDKIRSASTYGQLAALGLNIFVFVSAIIFVEPWKRKRLAQTFEKKVEELSESTKNMMDGRMKDLESQLESQAELLRTMLEKISPTLPSVPDSRLVDNEKGNINHAAVTKISTEDLSLHSLALGPLDPIVTVGILAAGAGSLCTWLIFGR